MPIWRTCYGGCYLLDCGPPLVWTCCRSCGLHVALHVMRFSHNLLSQFCSSMISQLMDTIFETNFPRFTRPCPSLLRPYVTISGNQRHPSLADPALVIQLPIPPYNVLRPSARKYRQKQHDFPCIFPLITPPIPSPPSSSRNLKTSSERHELPTLIFAPAAPVH